ncbi:hypothetical protein BU26DRAFT_1635 [Trematosphaeria pertusa]|uniref:Uncharacterized protein n=1 Tax=Trematosphaeria pertusa TaxID=390896 RepID=A0A6A6IYW6_9PLEO|nr:uncharacterized protein BU26DRAFT_1635 [Trematosphaeria pertusa]KAF2255536.1 hypothetical protein BU26DRAFT_1635 [Trematosphaeria pertusa]
MCWSCGPGRWCMVHLRNRSYGCAHAETSPCSTAGRESGERACLPAVLPAFCWLFASERPSVVRERLEEGHSKFVTRPAPRASDLLFGEAGARSQTS